MLRKIDDTFETFKERVDPKGEMKEAKLLKIFLKGYDAEPKKIEDKKDGKPTT